MKKYFLTPAFLTLSFLSAPIAQADFNEALAKTLGSCAYVGGTMGLGAKVIQERYVKRIALAGCVGAGGATAYYQYNYIPGDDMPAKEDLDKEPNKSDEE